MDKILCDKAYELGITAYKNGSMCIPARDSIFLNEIVKGCQVGESIPYIKAWLKGWTDANLSDDTWKKDFE